MTWETYLKDFLGVVDIVIIDSMFYITSEFTFFIRFYAYSRLSAISENFSSSKLEF